MEYQRKNKYVNDIRLAWILQYIRVDFLVRVDIVSDIGIAKGWILWWKPTPKSYIEVDFAI